MKALVLDCHLVFNLSDLDLYKLIGFFNLEVSYLCDEWLDLFPNLFDELPSLDGIHLLRALSSHKSLHLLGHHSVHLFRGHFVSHWATRRYWCITMQRTHCFSVWQDHELLTIRSCDYLTSL